MKIISWNQLKKFHEKAYYCTEIFYYHFTLWSLLNFCITWKLFREINYIVNSLLKKLFSRKFFKKLWYKNFVKSTQCVTYCWTKTSPTILQKIPWKQCYYSTTLKEVTKELISRNFLSVIAFYSTFPDCAQNRKISFVKSSFLASLSWTSNSFTFSNLQEHIKF